ncbi:MAG: heme ABC transporter ATP-binding protein [Burkholderiaceae bacterium]|nr:heme ABC transporter ATP-binding protein [Burkholderiaceae bacterium]
MLTAEDLACARGPRTVLSGVSLDLPPGEVLGVLGANGAGKTTLLATLAGELKPAAGELRLGEQAIASIRHRELARRRAVLPQVTTPAFDLETRTVVAMGAYPFPELAPDEVDALVTRALRLADASDLADRRIATLSGGEMQRVQFARVLVQLLAAREPGEYRVLFLDEPTAALDPLHQATLLQAVRDIVREMRLAALVVLHDVNLAATWCDRLLLLAAGRTVALDTPARALTAAHLRTAYAMSATVLEHPLRPGTPLVLFGDAPA